MPESILQTAKRGQINEPRNVALYLARKRSGLRLEDIGKEFGINKYSSVSSIIVRTKKQLSANKHMQKQVENIVSTFLSLKIALFPCSNAHQTTPQTELQQFTMARPSMSGPACPGLNAFIFQRIKGTS
ncbi:helix-turn-helix domain-containing protein [Desulfosediminicola flagellatus]|uniref:helix-turn-helix domain-containing protein n=1 Tax=Desulfosediminicola flagellatus TaxID=2569541 RepID=UPI00142EBF28|nr:helix-turn-helix domain-containing protein [Desulfosediminicola flagellatus]